MEHSVTAVPGKGVDFFERNIIVKILHGLFTHRAVRQNIFWTNTF